MTATTPTARTMTLKGDLTLIPQTTETHLECLVLDHFTPDERNVADLLAAHLGAVYDGFGEHRVRACPDRGHRPRAAPHLTGRRPPRSVRRASRSSGCALVIPLTGAAP